MNVLASFNPAGNLDPNLDANKRDGQAANQSVPDESALRHTLVQDERRLDRSSERIAASWMALPPELIDHILSHLSAHDLVTISATNRSLRKHATSDMHWQRCVQQNVPGQVVTKAGPCATFRQLYVAHDLFWFLPRHKIWFCDRDLLGKLILVRFDQRRGCIEGYQLLAVSNHTTLEHWPAGSQVIVHGFEPRVKLHLDKPVLQLRVPDRQEDGGFTVRTGVNRFAAERPMELEDSSQAMFSNFLLARALSPGSADAKLSADYPYGNVWPPPAVPSRHHVFGARSPRNVVNLPPATRPRSRDEVSAQVFRIRHWMEMMGTPAPRGLMGHTGSLPGASRTVAGPRAVGDDVAGRPGSTRVHIGEEVVTYSMLDPALYTPTPTKPWRGIWVGDYSGHGCEFLLVHQPDDPPVTDPELGLVRGEQETHEAWERRRRDARVHRGRLEAIKLTGDPNVPRGEYTFVADDLGPGGYIRVATDGPFAGARVVRSKGHVAGTGFVNGELPGPDASCPRLRLMLVSVQTSTSKVSFCSCLPTGWRSTGSGLAISAFLTGWTLTSFLRREACWVLLRSSWISLAGVATSHLYSTRVKMEAGPIGARRVIK